MKIFLPIFLLLYVPLAMAQLPLQNEFDQLLIESIEKFNVPSIAAAVVYEGNIHYLGAKGLRSLDNKKDSVTIEDRYHLGSNTKAFTAYWAAVLVEAGKIAWDSKLMDVLPELKTIAQKAYHPYTLADLLSHRAQIPPFMSGDDYLKIPDFEGSKAERLKAFGQYVVSLPPVDPGLDAYTYSNAGYSLATLMLEKASGMSWEIAMKEAICKPLNISCSVGWPDLEMPHHPSGHIFYDDKLMPMPKDWGYHLEDFVAPAGDLSMSIADYACFLSDNLNGIIGQKALLKTASYAFLHFGRPHYAMGWLNANTETKKFSTHDGSAGTFMTHALLLPNQKMAIAVFINASDNNAEKAVYWLEAALIKNTILKK